MATQLTRPLRRSRSARFVQASEAETRHPAVAIAIAVPCAILLLALFGGWDQLVAQTKAVAALLGR